MERGIKTHNNHEENHVFDGVETQESLEIDNYDNSD